MIGKKISGRAFHFNVECWGITIGSIGSQRLSERTNSANEVVGDWAGRAQLLDRISPLNERLTSLIDRTVENTDLLLPRLRMKQFGNAAEKRSSRALKLLQQRIVQFARDAGLLVNPRIQRDRELALESMQQVTDNMAQSDTRNASPHIARNQVVL